MSEKFGIWNGDYPEKMFASYKKDFAEKMKLTYKQGAYKKAVEFAPISDIHFNDLYPMDGKFISHDKLKTSKPDKYPLHCKLWLAGYSGDKVEECCKVCHSGSLDHSWGFRHTLNKSTGGTEYVVCCQLMKICLKV